MAPPTPHVVRVLTAGAALTLAASGCAKEEPPATPPMPVPTGNPPVPDIAPPPAPPADGQAGSTDATLPTWESVASGHPEGATNPPRPVLAVTEDGRCFKEWVGGMLPPDPEVRAIGGRVISGPEDTQGTETRCPPHAEKVMAAHAARSAPPAPDGE